MKPLLLALSFAYCAEAQSKKSVTYIAEQATVQDIVQTMASQAGFGYNWQKSFDRTDPLCRQWVRGIRIQGISFDIAMHRILDPVGLGYVVEEGNVVLFRSAKGVSTSLESPPIDLTSKTVSYSGGQISVQYLVIDMAKQVGLGYEWNKSFSQTDPQCRRLLDDISFKDQLFNKAMVMVLEPVGLSYRLEGNQVVLYRR